MNCLLRFKSPHWDDAHAQFISFCSMLWYNPTYSSLIICCKAHIFVRYWAFELLQSTDITDAYLITHRLEAHGHMTAQNNYFTGQAWVGHNSHSLFLCNRGRCNRGRLVSSISNVCDQVWRKKQWEENTNANEREMNETSPFILSMIVWSLLSTSLHFSLSWRPIMKRSKRRRRKSASALTISAPWLCTAKQKKAESRWGLSKWAEYTANHPQR